MDQACVTWPDKFWNVRFHDKTLGVNHCIFVYFLLLLRLKNTISRMQESVNYTTAPHCFIFFSKEKIIFSKRWMAGYSKFGQ